MSKVLDIDELKIVVMQVLGDQISFALLFGSYAKGQMTEHSDVDLAVYFLNPTSAEILLNKRNELELLLKKNVDLIDLRGANLILAMQILGNAEILVLNNFDFFVGYKSNILSQYPDFKFSRKIVEENVAVRRSHVRK